MQIAALSEATGIPVPRIKFYLRERLLPKGVATASNRAEYGPEHVHRLRLIRALVTVGGMGVEDARAVLDELDAPDSSLDRAVGVAMAGAARKRDPRTDDTVAAARARLESIITERGWTIADDDPARDDVIDAVATMLELDAEHLAAAADRYAAIADQLAAVDFGAIAQVRDPGAIVESAVIGTVVGERLLAALRRLAHSNLAVHTFGSGVPTGHSPRHHGAVPEPSPDPTGAVTA